MSKLCCTMSPMLEDQPCETCWTLRFWDVVRKSEASPKKLETLLESWSLKELSCYQAVWYAKIGELYDKGWPSGRDGFDYAAMSVVSQGQEYFESVLEESSFGDDVSESYGENELFSYVAAQVAEKKFGEDTELLEVL